MFARIKADGSYYHSFVGARMIDRLERRDGRWGIAHRQLIWNWNHDAPAAHANHREPRAPRPVHPRIRTSAAAAVPIPPWMSHSICCSVLI
jgi:hypothetical protein